MEFDQPLMQQEHGHFALVRTSSGVETQFLTRGALATSDKDFYDQIQGGKNPDDGTALVMRAFVESALDNVEHNSFMKNLAWCVSKRKAREIKSQITQ